MNEIPPVFVFSTGRCGSTVISQMLNKHPDILSLSEFFSVLGLRAFVGKKVSGDWMWRLYSEPAQRTSIEVASQNRTGRQGVFRRVTEECG